MLNTFFLFISNSKCIEAGNINLLSGITSIQESVFTSEFAENFISSRYPCSVKSSITMYASAKKSHFPKLGKLPALYWVRTNIPALWPFRNFEPFEHSPLLNFSSFWPHITPSRIGRLSSSKLNWQCSPKFLTFKVLRRSKQTGKKPRGAFGKRSLLKANNHLQWAIIR